MVLMRRHIWLYAEFQAIFVSAVEHQQAAESLNRTILMFDYAIYVITEKYQFLIQSGIRKKVGGMLIHGAIIAREYGIPCVTGIHEATELIRTGDLG